LFLAEGRREETGEEKKEGISPGALRNGTREMVTEGGLRLQTIGLILGNYFFPAAD
jgi:hypothetical protein